MIKDTRDRSHTLWKEGGSEMLMFDYGGEGRGSCAEH